MNKKQLYMKNKTRLTYVNSYNGKFNWLFLPGGPGLDSSIFLDFAKSLNLPGSIWLVDLPGNGDNYTENPTPCKNWENDLLETVQLFDNPILVGHSYGAMLALSIPALKNYLSSFVVLHSAPQNWQHIQEKYKEKYSLPDTFPSFEKFVAHPNRENFDEALKYQIPYCFNQSKYGSTAINLVLSTPQPYQILEWNAQNFFPTYEAKWIFDNIPSLIITSENDYATPKECFKENKKFDSKNIHFVELKEVSHFSWLEDPRQVKITFEDFAHNFLSK
jgi:pimeloyl-ACP methyl ester carboxylesterase